jgi:hypothetical protein
MEDYFGKLINDCAAGNGHAENMGRLPLSR